ncbi:MAG: alpha/beta fold hydrolase [Corynebacterium sp.]|uniref:alpha/beta fold hydrolase n=1 Tax=Corynebacterium sp. TaxID=1720 RepID=UPI0026DF05EF|nr:alpha/beta fold hydrolase [Corynebacterium sp.]MDO5668618.1 alpha/beta fold hydrolase [Corynebacterium sp.]
MTVLFLHGGGGWDDDQPIVDALRAQYQVHTPVLDAADLSYTRWSAQITDALSPGTPLVVGHSLGGSVALKMATQGRLPVHRLVLLAAPEWGPRGWDVADYALADTARLPANLQLELHHCADDDVVPPAHLELLAARFPESRARLWPDGGHQFTGRDVVGSLP